LKIAGEENFLTDAFGPGANGQRFTHGREAVKSYFQPREHPHMVPGKHAVIIKAQAGSVRIGSILKRLKDGGRFPAVIDIRVVGMYADFIRPDGCRLQFLSSAIPEGQSRR
jgi:hypothetical protein